MSEFRVQVFMLNEHFSQEHADANFNGQESENNKRLDWEDELILRGENEFHEEKENSVYFIRGHKGENLFEIPVQGMRIFSFVEKGVLSAEIACSETLYENHVINGNTLELTLKGEPYANPIPGIYISSNEFPKELIVGD